MDPSQLVLLPADREEEQHTTTHMTQQQIEHEVRHKAQDEERKDDHCFCEEQGNERGRKFWNVIRAQFTPKLLIRLFHNLG